MRGVKYVQKYMLFTLTSECILVYVFAGRKQQNFLTKKLPELALVTGGMTFGTQISPLLNVYVY